MSKFVRTKPQVNIPRIPEPANLQGPQPREVKNVKQFRTLSYDAQVPEDANIHHFDDEAVAL